MPRYNYFYHFLVGSLKKNTHVDQHGSKFVVIDLPEEIAPCYGKMISHLSIYEKYDKEKDCMSILHYTGYFSTQSQDWRVHLYFDEQGGLLNAPHYAVKNGSQWDGSRSSEMQSEENTLFFTAQASERVRHWMASIKKDIAITLTRLEDQAAGLQRNLRQLSTSSSSQQIKSTVKEYQKNLNARKALTGNRGSLCAQEIRLNHFARVLIEAKDAQSKPTVIHDEVETEVDECEIDGPLAPTSRAHLARPVPLRQRWMDELQAQKDVLTQLTSGESTLQSDHHYQRLLEWILNIDLKREQAINAWPADLCLHLEQFYIALEEAGGQRYRSVFFGEKTRDWPERLKILSVFEDKFTHQDFCRVIELGDVEMLRALGSSVDAFLELPIRLGKKGQRSVHDSIVHYCVFLAKNQPNHPFLKPCMMWLMNKEVSLFVEVDNKYLFLEWIQYQPQHPLYEFISSFDLWLKPSVLMGLRSSLLQKLKDPNIDPTERDALVAKAEIYKTISLAMISMLDTLQAMPLLGMASAMKSCEEKLALSISQRYELWLDAQYRELMLEYTRLSLSNMKIVKPIMDRFPQLMSLLITTIMQIGAAEIPNMTRIPFEQKKIHIKQLLSQAVNELKQQRLQLDLLPSMSSFFSQSTSRGKNKGRSHTPESEHRKDCSVM